VFIPSSPVYALGTIPRKKGKTQTVVDAIVREEDVNKLPRLPARRRSVDIDLSLSYSNPHLSWSNVQPRHCFPCNPKAVRFKYSMASTPVPSTGGASTSKSAVPAHNQKQQSDQTYRARRQQEEEDFIKYLTSMQTDADAQIRAFSRLPYYLTPRELETDDGPLLSPEELEQIAAARAEIREDLERTAVELRRLKRESFERLRVSREHAE